MAEPLTPDARWAALDGNEAALRPLTREQVAIIVSDVRTRPHRHPATQCRLAVTLESALAKRDAARPIVNAAIEVIRSMNTKRSADLVKLRAAVEAYEAATETQGPWPIRDEFEAFKRNG